MDERDVIAALDLAPHPEGGYFVETWRDEAATAIYFLVPAGARSKWHRVLDRSEVFHFYAGDPLELETNPLAPSADGSSTVVLGPHLDAGERPQAVVSADCWQRARSTGRWTLVGCTVSPPFSFEAFELADDEP